MTLLDQQLDFLLQIEQLKSVYRQTKVKPDNNRRENSAEHSWHIALVAQVFIEYAANEVDLTRVVNMLLIHDIVEIDAGDTFAFADTTALKAQIDLEEKAAKRLFGLLPEKQAEQFKALWFEFEDAQTNDAKYAKAMDCILPFIQNMQNEGGTWVEHRVIKSKVVKRNEYLKQNAPKLWVYVLEQIDVAVTKGWLIDDE